MPIVRFRNGLPVYDPYTYESDSDSYKYLRVIVHLKFIETEVHYGKTLRHIFVNRIGGEYTFPVDKFVSGLFSLQKDHCYLIEVSDRDKDVSIVLEETGVKDG